MEDKGLLHDVKKNYGLPLVFQKNCFSLFQIDLIATFHVEKFYEKRLILRKLSMKNLLALIDSCQHVVTRSQFVLKDHVTDTVLCDFHTFVCVLKLGVVVLL